MSIADVPVAPEPVRESEPSNAFEPSMPARVLLATLSGAAGAIHLVMVPSHVQEWTPEGYAFAAAGWLQLGLAALLIARPSRAVVKTTIVANLVFVAAWAVTRTMGAPFGPHAGHPETASFIDLATVGLEAALVLAAGVLLARPNLGKDWNTGALAAATIVPLSVLALTTAVLASPDAANHSHGSHGDHGDALTAAGATGDGHDHGADGHGTADHSTAAAATDQSGTTGDGHDHGTDGHDHESATAAATVDPDERCDWEMNTVDFWAQNPPAASDGSHEHGHGAGNGQGNEHGIQPWAPMTDKAQCAELTADIASMERIAEALPTAQDAMNAGCFRVTIYVEGIAAHYICPARLRDGLKLEEPEMILYGGSQPWAPIVGLSYMVYQDTPPNEQPSAPLWARYMTWHFHEGLCIKGGLVIGGDNSDQAKCEAQGGKKMGRTGYMGHYWLPQCNSSDGVFSAANPRLDLAVANYNDDPANQGKDLVTAPCSGSGQGPSDEVFGRPDGETETAAAAPR